MIGKWVGLGLGAALLILGLSAWPRIRPMLNETTNIATSSGDYQHAQVVFGEQAVKVLIPNSQATSALGLGGRTALTDSEGMLWQYAQPEQPTFWMHGMLIPLDFIWLQDSKVIEILPDVTPPAAGTDPIDLPLYRPSQLVDGVLEVPAGFAERHQVRIGDPVEIIGD